MRVAVTNDFAGGGPASWWAKAHYPRLLLPLSAKPWMPTFVGMTVVASIISQNF